jgi:hypothetical protein
MRIKWVTDCVTEKKWRMQHGSGAAEHSSFYRQVEVQRSRERKRMSEVCWIRNNRSKNNLQMTRRKELRLVRKMKVGVVQSSVTVKNLTGNSGADARSGRCCRIWSAFDCIVCVFNLYSVRHFFLVDWDWVLSQIEVIDRLRIYVSRLWGDGWIDLIWFEMIWFDSI